MKYALFTGCSVPVKARHYEMSARQVAKKLGIEFVDLPEFGCCGFPVKSVHHDTFISMAEHNLKAAANKNLDICCLCSACTSVLAETNKLLSKTDKKYKPIKVKHIARVLHEDVGINKITEMCKNGKPRISTLKIAPHYGCHYIKPSVVYDKYDDPENPHSLDELIRATGATSVDYTDKESCCGAGVLAINENIALGMSNKKLKNINDQKADAITLICPFCGVMYDESQRKIEAKFNTTYNIPVLYYTQLLGLALGIDQKELGFRINKVRVDALLEKLK